MFVSIFNVLYKCFVCSLLLFSCFTLSAAEPAFDHQHSLWSKVLSNIVITQGAFSRVDYEHLKNKPDDFQQYLSKIESLKRSQFEQFSTEQKLAFLINYYNAQQIRLVIDNYPIQSIKDLGFLFYTPWKKEFFTIFGQTASLDYIEHELIRKTFKEPRIHFAVNCASIGCPPLLDQAYTAEALQQQLEHVTSNFLNAKALNHYDATQHQLTLSPIFSWYKKDFGDDKALQNFVARYMEGFIMKDSLASVQYSVYDWGLNDSKAGL